MKNKKTYFYSYGETLSEEERMKRGPFEAISCETALTTLKDSAHNEALHIANINNTEVRMDSGVPNIFGGTVPGSRSAYTVSKGSVDVFQVDPTSILKFVWPGGARGVDYSDIGSWDTLYYDEPLRRTKLFPQILLEALQDNESVRQWQDRIRQTVEQDALKSVDVHLAKESEHLNEIKERAREFIRKNRGFDSGKAYVARYLGSIEEARALVRDAVIRPILAKGREYGLQEVIKKAEEVLGK